MYNVFLVTGAEKTKILSLKEAEKDKRPVQRADRV